MSMCSNVKFQEMTFLRSMLVKMTERIERVEKTVDIRLGKAKNRTESRII
jgi:hypothetical protein